MIQGVSISGEAGTLANKYESILMMTVSPLPSRYHTPVSPRSSFPQSDCS